tara:strand:+ start:1930 stop:2526 length:597 start_codon:yes stop_codon:yes gene_type:complete
MTRIIGITGGIGSGKSTLSNYIKKTGYLVHDSDKVVSSIYKNPKKNFIKFIKKCGLEKALKNNKINKKIITSEIFNNHELKKKFENYIHKEVKEQRKKFIKKNLNKKTKAIFVDVPLLFENKLDEEFDLVVCVVATKKNRIKRVLNNKKFSKTLINKIIKTQTTDRVRRERASIILTNNKTKKDFIFRTQKALISILK